MKAKTSSQDPKNIMQEMAMELYGVESRSLNQVFREGVKVQRDLHFRPSQGFVR